MTELSPEQKLKAIIQAQIAGGYRFEFPCQSIFGLLMVSDEMYAEVLANAACANDNELLSVLPILLDTQGCKAVYGEGDHDFFYRKCKRCGQRKVDYAEEITSASDLYDRCYDYVSHEILDAWNSGEGNDYLSAIDTAYSLLPHE